VKVVVVGGGDTGAELVEMLLKSGEDEVVVVESDKARCDELAGTLDALVLQGDGTHPELLQKAGVGEGAALVAATGSDALNTVIALLGHRLGAERVVVRLDDLGLRPACREMGVTEIVAPRLAAAARMLAAVRGLHRLDLSLVARGGLRLVELPARAWAGRAVEDCPMPSGCLAVAAVRNQGVLLASRTLELEQGDTLMLLVESDQAEERLGRELTPPEAAEA
jgi:trk system potassium uptake protein TrkA